MTKYSSDTAYRQYNFDIQYAEAKHSGLYFTQAFSDIKFHTMEQYKQAKAIQASVKNITQDINYIKSNRTPYEKSLIRQTYINQNLQEISKNAQILAPIVSYERGGGGNQLARGIAEINRAGQNVTGKRVQIKDYSESEPTRTLQKRVNEHTLDITLSVNGNYNENYYQAHPEVLDSIQEQAVKIAVPHMLILTATVLQRSAPLIEGVLNFATDTLNQVASAVGNLSQQILDWGDFKTNPMGVIINVIESASSVMTSSLSIVGAITDSLFKSLGKGIVGALFGEGDEKDKDTMGVSFFKLLGRVFASLGKLIAGALNLAVQGISFSITSFVTIMSSIFSLVREIIKTSPVMEAILNYLSLALSLFFLPFFTAFGLPLLDQIMGIMSWVISEPRKLLDAFSSQLGSEEEITAYIVSILGQLDDVLGGIDKKDLYTKAQKLIKATIDFIKAFVKEIIDNSDKIDDLLTQGLSVFNDMLKNGLIKAFIDMGNSGLDFIDKNQEELYTLIQTVFDVARAGLEVFSIAMNNFYQVICGTIVGLSAILGGIVGYKVGELITVLSGGTLAPSLIIAQLAGIAAGQAQGAGVQYYLYTEYIDEDNLSYYANYPVPDASTLTKFAYGGKVLKRNGGQYGIMSEAGHGEWAIPESKTKLFRGNNNVVVRINGKIYNKSAIDSAMRELENTLVFPFESN